MTLEEKVADIKSRIVSLRAFLQCDMTTIVSTSPTQVEEIIPTPTDWIAVEEVVVVEVVVVEEKVEPKKHEPDWEAIARLKAKNDEMAVMRAKLSGKK
jgi:hypothetical protein